MAAYYRKIARLKEGESYRGLSESDLEWLAQFDNEYYARGLDRDIMCLPGCVHVRDERHTDGYCSEVIAWWQDQERRRLGMRKSCAYTAADYRGSSDSPEAALVGYIDLVG